MLEVIKLSIYSIIFVILLVDVIMKFRRGIVIENIRTWGLISPVYLSLIGGISIYLVGWVGWVLMVIAAVVSTDILEHPKPGVGAVNEQDPDVSLTPLNKIVVRSRANQCSILVIAEFLCLGVIASNIFGLSQTVFENLI